MRLVASAGEGLANEVDVLDTSKPLFMGKLNLANEVVHVADHAREDDSVSICHVGAHVINDMLCEVGIKAVRLAIWAMSAIRGAAIGAVCGHDVGFALCSRLV